MFIYSLKIGFDKMPFVKGIFEESMKYHIKIDKIGDLRLAMAPAGCRAKEDAIGIISQATRYPTSIVVQCCG